jgi:hypothetical protein
VSGKELRARERKAVARRRAVVLRRVRLAAAAFLTAAVVALVVIGLVTGGPSGRPAGSPRGSGVGAALVGRPAPDASFTTTSGATSSLSSYRGKPVMLWLMTTWCGSCEGSTWAVKQNIDRLAKAGVIVLELENYADLGAPGPSVDSFVRTILGTDQLGPNWILGQASYKLTRLYNPQGYLDLYYLIDPRGYVRFVASSPIDTMGQLLAQVRRLDGPRAGTRA